MHTLYHAIDWVAVGITIAAIAGWAPPAAALMSIIWLGMQATTWIVNKGWQRK
jgi:hypothetical protein